MIILNSSDKRLIGTLSSSPSVNPDYIVQYADIAGPATVGTFDGLGQFEGEMSSSGVYTFLDSPSGSLIRRDVKYIKVHNSDAADIDFKLSLTSSKGEFTIFDGTVEDKHTLFYDADGIIRLVDDRGREVTSTVSTIVTSGSSESSSYSNFAVSSSYSETASYVSWNNVDAKPFELVNQLDCDLGIDVVDTFETSSGRTVEWLVNVFSGSNMRSSKVLACWLGDEVRFTEQSTNDIGTTKKIDFEVDVSSSFVRLLCDNTDSNNWEIKTLRTVI